MGGFGGAISKPGSGCKPPVTCPFADLRRAPGRLGIEAQGIARLEMQVALDAEPEQPLDAFQFTQGHAAQLRTAETDVGKAEQQVGLVGVHLGDEPGGGPGRMKEPDHRPMVLSRPPAVLEQALPDLLGDELHGETPSHATGGESLSLALRPVARRAAGLLLFGAPPTPPVGQTQTWQRGRNRGFNLLLFFN